MLIPQILTGKLALDRGGTNKRGKHEYICVFVEMDTMTQYVSARRHSVLPIVSKLIPRMYAQRDAQFVL